MGLISGISNFCDSATKFAGDLVGEVAGQAVSAFAGPKVGEIVEGFVSDGVEALVSGTSFSPNWGSIAEQLCDTLLPEDLEIVGDLASAAVNIYTCNYPALIEDGLDTLENVPALTNAVANSVANTPSEAPATDKIECGKNPLGEAPPVDTTSGNSSAGGTEGSSGAAKQETTASASTTSTQSTGGSEETKTRKQIETEGKQAAQNFLNTHSNPEDLMNAIRNGEIPDEVLNSQGGMMMLQQQMNQIQMMNTIMTNMLKSMHDMQMAIASNMRV